MDARTARRDRTRATLLAESRRLFAARGYAAVGLAEIVAAAGVTKGALYHHFANKADLFRAVLDQVQREVADRVAATADARPDPWEQLVAGCTAFLAAAADPEIQQIMLIDAPAVLGWNEWRAMDEENSARHLAESLSSLMAAGIVEPQPVEPLTRLLSGAMNEAVLWLARTDDPDALPATTAALTRLLTALRTQSG